jgi:hypothetical protein
MADIKVSSLASLTGANVDVAADVINIVDTSATTSGSKKIKVEELFKSASLVPQVDGLVINKATGKGIKVDTASPTFGYRDMLGEITVRGSGAANPSWILIRGTPPNAVYGYEFPATPENECWLNFHLPHDYVPGSNIYFHAHFVNIAAAPNTGGVVWGFDYSSARGYDQEVFPAVQTVTVTKACHATRYMHQIAETTAVTIANLEIDSLILVRAYRKTADAGDTCTDAVHLLYVDLHYQSNGVMGTKDKNYPFYT